MPLTFGQRVFKWVPLALLIVVLALGAAATRAEGGNAGGEQRGRPLLPAKSNAAWQEECSGCHIAYAPGLLGAASWRKIMSGLDQHFGVDASLPAASNTEITAFLTQHASQRWSAKTAPLRITESGWFRSAHNPREVNPAVFKRASIKSSSNCGACHSQADQGRFDERAIRIPAQ